MLKLLKKIVSSRVGLILVGVHLCLVIYAFSGKTPDTLDNPCIEPEQHFAGHSTIAQRTFHWTNESLIFKTVSLLDIPSMVIAAILMIPFGWILNDFCYQATHWIASFWMLFCASVQWLIIGYAIERFYTYRKNLFK